MADQPKAKRAAPPIGVNTKRSSKTPANKGATSGRRAASSSKRRRKPRLIWRVLRWLLVLFVLLGVVGAAGAYIFYQRTELPSPNANFTTQTTTLLYGDGETELGRLAIQNRSAIDYSQMPQSMKDAVVAAEDRTFWTNRGIDIKGMSRAVWNIIRGQDLQGGSTITQQYIKIRYLTSDQTLMRKFRELALAIKMSKAESKQDVLAGYLNTIYFGRGAYGVQAAGQTYFGLDAENLSLAQSAALAAMVNSPSLLDPANGAQAQQNLLERYNYVLDGMKEMGTVDEASYQANYGKLPEFPKFDPTDTFSGAKGFLIQMATDELRDHGFTENQIQGGGLTITTTFDPKLQQGAVDAVNKVTAQAVENANPLLNPDGTVKRDAQGDPVKPDPKQLHTGLASINVTNGEVVALYGGADFVKNSRNWATTPRYAASTFKVYGVIAGLRNGFSLRSMLRGSTYTPKGDKVPVQNDSGYNYGNITLMKATQDSVNTAFVDLIGRIPDGTTELIRAANDAGVPTQDSWAPQGGRLVLGEGEVSALSNAAGYATIANQGLRISPHVVREVKDANGQVIFKGDTSGAQTVEKAVARDTIAALHNAVAGSTIDAVGGRDVAGKTGTEGIAVGQEGAQQQVTRSAWLAGFTADIATAVVMVAGDDGVGNLDPYARPGTGAFYGAGYPTAVWNDYMAVAVAGMPEKSFPKPANIRPSEPNPLPAPRTNQAPPTRATSSTPPPSSTAPSQPQTAQEPATSTQAAPATSAPLPPPNRSAPSRPATSRIPSPTATREAPKSSAPAPSSGA